MFRYFRKSFNLSIYYPCLNKRKNKKKEKKRQKEIIFVEANAF